MFLDLKEVPISSCLGLCICCSGTWPLWAPGHFELWHLLSPCRLGFWLCSGTFEWYRSRYGTDFARSETASRAIGLPVILSVGLKLSRALGHRAYEDSVELVWHVCCRLLYGFHSVCGRGMLGLHSFLCCLRWFLFCCSVFGVEEDRSREDSSSCVLAFCAWRSCMPKCVGLRIVYRLLVGFVGGLHQDYRTFFTGPADLFPGRHMPHANKERTALTWKPEKGHVFRFHVSLAELSNEQH